MKKKSFNNKRDSPSKFKVVPSPTIRSGSITLEIDKLMKDKLTLLLRNSIDGYLEAPIATVESGQPDFDKVESANPEFISNESSNNKDKGKSPRGKGENSKASARTPGGIKGIGANKKLRKVASKASGKQLLSGRNLVLKAGGKKGDGSKNSRRAKGELSPEIELDSDSLSSDSDEKDN